MHTNNIIVQSDPVREVARRLGVALGKLATPYGSTADFDTEVQSIKAYADQHGVPFSVDTAKIMVDNVRHEMGDSWQASTQEC